MIAAVILASGLSERLGNNKLLMPLGNQSVVEHVIDSVKSSKIENIFLVYGKNESEFKTISHHKKINLIYNEKYYYGQSMSVKSALNSIGNNFQGIMFLLGDQPFIKTKTINLLIEHFNKNPLGIIVPTYQGKRGNPVIFSRDFFTQIKNIQGDKGAREVIEKNYNEVIHVPIADSFENFDIDTRKDYEKALFKIGS
jgi:molybdenum cofactor cytidylyltransferase